ncbi:MAG: hypothetical protein OXN44_14135 [Acidimicrobiaceae bacterium]|nr:hypothetical protein [Acidimicrobiaceae bacterium]
MPSDQASVPWRIHFFQRDVSDDPAEAVPARDFLECLPENLRAKFEAVLKAAAAAPPPKFRGGGKWKAMHGDMSGFYQIGIQGKGMNHRLVCLLHRPADDNIEPSIVCLGGFSKRRRSAARPRDYRRMRDYRDEFWRTGNVM